MCYNCVTYICRIGPSTLGISSILTCRTVCFTMFYMSPSARMLSKRFGVLKRKDRCDWELKLTGLTVLIHLECTAVIRRDALQVAGEWAAGVICGPMEMGCQSAARDQSWVLESLGLEMALGGCEMSVTTDHVLKVWLVMLQKRLSWRKHTRHEGEATLTALLREAGLVSWKTASDASAEQVLS